MIELLSLAATAGDQSARAAGDKAPSPDAGKAQDFAREFAEASAELETDTSDEASPGTVQPSAEEDRGVFARIAWMLSANAQQPTSTARAVVDQSDTDTRRSSEAGGSMLGTPKLLEALRLNADSMATGAFREPPAPLDATQPQTAAQPQAPAQPQTAAQPQTPAQPQAAQPQTAAQPQAPAQPASRAAAGRSSEAAPKSKDEAALGATNARGRGLPTQTPQSQAPQSQAPQSAAPQSAAPQPVPSMPSNERLAQAKVAGTSGEAPRAGSRAGVPQVAANQPAERRSPAPAGQLPAGQLLAGFAAELLAPGLSANSAPQGVEMPAPAAATIRGTAATARAESEAVSAETSGEPAHGGSRAESATSTVVADARDGGSERQPSQGEHDGRKESDPGTGESRALAPELKLPGATVPVQAATLEQSRGVVSDASTALRSEADQRASERRQEAAELGVSRMALRRGIVGHIESAELGRIEVRAEGKSGIELSITARDAAAAATISAAIPAMTADLRAGNVRLESVNVGHDPRGGDHASREQGQQSSHQSREREESTVHDLPKSAANRGKSSRVRIVL